MNEELAKIDAAPVIEPEPRRKSVTPPMEVETEMLGKLCKLTLKPHSHRFFGASR